jgi:small subunit ribosomal protein S4
MIRKKNLYARPKKLYEKIRINEENELKRKYALKSKREIWKTVAKLKYFRHRAIDLAKAPSDEQNVFIGKLKGLGLNVNTISDILALKLQDILERRLTTIVCKRKLANTPQHARQLVAHKKVLVGEKVIRAPSFIVPVSLEKEISVKAVAKKPKVEVKSEEVVANG